MTTATTAAPHLSPGTVIDGTYTLGATVRTRGGSATYEATDLSGGRVEVTVYAANCFVSPVALERSLREMRQLEKVHSPHVVRVFDAGKVPQGGIYEVHERITGTSLAEFGVLPEAEVVQVIHVVVAGLAAAQKVGVVHRNLGAGSILRSGADIRLFGFAVGDPQGGVSFGAIDCIAPEQVEGKNIDERTLVYNLAALTYRLLKGQSLFTTEDTGTALLQHAASLPPEGSMPAALFAGLAKDPKARPALTKFLGDLDQIVREFPRAHDHREHSDMLDELMQDSDAPTSAPSPAPAAAAAPVTTAKPAVTPPPSVGPKAPVVAPPAVGKPAGPPTVSAPSFAPPSVSPPSFAAPTLGAPVAAPSASTGTAGAKPRTRGWTMFMEATDGESGGVAAPGVPVGPPPPAAPISVTAQAAPVPAPAQTPAPAPVQAAAAAPVAGGEVKPSTRGWTMIMDEPSEADAAALAVTSPPAATTPVAGSPTTRGWTMLEELDDAAPAAAAAAATPTAAAVTATAPGADKADTAAAGGNAPSSRGWTMFMEAELQNKEGGEPDGEPAEAEPAFFDGPVTTDAGTVVAFAPTSDAPHARARAAEPVAAAGEELQSFGARFRGADDDAAPKTASAESPASEVPSFTGNSSFDFGGLTPPAPAPVSPAPAAEKPAPAAAPTNPPESVFATAEAAEGGGGSKALVIIIVVLVIAAVAVLAFNAS